MIDIHTLRKRQSEARAKALNAAEKRHNLLRLLEDVGAQVAQQDSDIAKAKADEKRAREEQERQQRLRASQREYLEQAERRRKGLDHKELEQYAWYDGILPHQLEGIEFGAAARRWVLGDEPGLGKTRQAIGWLDAIKAKKVLIIAPTEVARQFANEIRELAEHRTLIELNNVTNPKIRRHRQERMLELDEGVVTMHYEAFRGKTGLLDAVLDWRADTIIVDEAHNIKNTSTAVFRDISKIISLDLYCGKCRREVPGLTRRNRNAQGRPVGPVIKVPCPHCGWKKGEPSGYKFQHKLDELTHTRSIKNVAMLTGTPLLNSPEELFSLFHLTRPDLFPNLAQFRKTFTYANSAGHRFFTKQGLENLKVLIAPIYIARKKSDAGIVLPHRDIETVMVPITDDEYPKQRKIIDQIANYSQILLEDGSRLTIMEQLAQLTRSRQANVYPGGIEVWHTDEDTGEKTLVFSTATEIDEAAKMDAIEERIFQHPNERQVIFSQFSTALAEQERRLKKLGISCVRLDGSTPRALREEIKTNFYAALGETPKWDVVLVNYRTGGAGLNLTSCTVTHLLDSEWNPGNEEQSLGRTWRIGQEQETTVYRYLVPGTVDTRIEAIKRRKQKLVEAFERGEISTLKFDKAAEIQEALGQ